MVSFYGDALDAGVFQGLESFYGSGEGAWEDLADMEEVAGNQNEIHFLSNGIGYNATKHTKEIFVALRFAGGGAVSFAQVDVSGV